MAPACICCATDTSPVLDRIQGLKDSAFPSKIQFSACGNTKEGMEKKKATRSLCYLRPSSFRRASFGDGTAREGLELRQAVTNFLP